VLLIHGIDNSAITGMYLLWVCRAARERRCYLHGLLALHIEAVLGAGPESDPQPANKGPLPS